MEPVGKAVRKILLDDATIVSLLGTVNVGAVHQGLAPQSRKYTLYIRFIVIDAKPNDTKSGPSTLDEMMVHVDVFGTNDADTEALNMRVREVLDRYPHGIVEGVELHGTKYMRGFMSPQGADAADKYQYSTTYQMRVGRSAYLV